MRVFQVDAFTNEIFKGNPAAVCLFVENEDDACHRIWPKK